MRDLIKLVEGLNEADSTSLVDKERNATVLMAVQKGVHVWYRTPGDHDRQTYAMSQAMFNVLCKSIESTGRHLWVVNGEKLGEDLDVNQFNEPSVLVVYSDEALTQKADRAIVIAHHDIESKKLPVAIVVMAPRLNSNQLQSRLRPV